MRSISFLMASESRLASGRLRNKVNSAAEGDERVAKGAADFFGRAGDSGGVRNAPVRGHGLAGPDGADFFRGVIADGENKIHSRRVGLRKFFPAFAARSFGGKVRGAGAALGLGAHGAGRKTSGAVRGEMRVTLTVEDCFGHDGPRRISGAEKQHVEVSSHSAFYAWSSFERRFCRRG